MASNASGDEGSCEVLQGVVPQEVPEVPPGAMEASQAEEGGPDREKDDAANAVSMLQEYIQSCSSFSPHTKILTWSFSQQLENDTSLQFRATVSFVFGDVPHHFCGGWQSSKKKAQRDTAERVRHYLSRRPEAPPAEAQAAGGSAAHAVVDPKSLPSDVLEEMQGALSGYEKQGGLLEWRVEDRKPPQDDTRVGSPLGAPLLDYRTTLTFHINDVPHHFCGSWCESAGLARKDVVERVLWYFGQSSEVFVAADRANLGACAAVVPPHELTLGTQGGRTVTPQGQATDDKTVLMQVQNALQKAFAKDTPPGQRVWVWSYEADPHDPQLFRAHVEVPSWTKTFVGDWARGKKLAQRSACLIVKSQLDARA